jgi:hypothetical protein
MPRTARNSTAQRLYRFRFQASTEELSPPSTRRAFSALSAVNKKKAKK